MLRLEATHRAGVSALREAVSVRLTASVELQGPNQTPIDQEQAAGAACLLQALTVKTAVRGPCQIQRVVRLEPGTTQQWPTARCEAPKSPPLRPFSGHPAAKSLDAAGWRKSRMATANFPPASHTYSARAQAAWCQDTVRRPSSSATRRPRAASLRTGLPARRLGRSSSAPFARPSSLAPLRDAKDARRPNPLPKDGPRAASNSRVGGRTLLVATLSGGGPGAEEPPRVDCHVQPRTSLIQLCPLPFTGKTRWWRQRFNAPRCYPDALHHPPEL